MHHSRVVKEFILLIIISYFSDDVCHTVCSKSEDVTGAVAFSFWWIPAESALGLSSFLFRFLLSEPAEQLALSVSLENLLVDSVVKVGTWYAVRLSSKLCPCIVCGHSTVEPGLWQKNMLRCSGKRGFHPLACFSKKKSLQLKTECEPRHRWT